MDSRARRLGARARSDIHAVRDAVSWIGARHPTVVYLGNTRSSNLGDLACLAAAKELLTSNRVVAWTRPRGPLVLGARRFRPATGLMLGGGTLVGRHRWHDWFVAAQHSLGAAAFSIGVGVEDPDSAAWGLTSDDELERWIPSLSAMEFLSVRGRRSAEILRAHGLNAAVTGDLALALHATPATPADKRFGLCVGAPHDGAWGNGSEELLDALVPLVAGLARDGWGVRLYVLDSSYDRAITHELARRVGLGDRVTIGEPTTPRELLNDVAGCTVLAGIRLHSVVLASVAGVPTIALAYRPKCEEFMESIGRNAWSMRTSSVSSDALRDMVEACSAQRDTQSTAVLAEVARWRTQLFAAAAEWHRISAIAR